MVFTNALHYQHTEQYNDSDKIYLDFVRHPLLITHPTVSLYKVNADKDLFSQNPV